MISESGQKVLSLIGQDTESVIEIQKLLTAIPAISPENGGRGEMQKCKTVMALLEDIGMDEIIRIDAPDSRAEGGVRPNILAKIKGKSSVKTIWIMSHMDIVPPGDLALWHTDPYKTEIKEGKIYGRGTEDDHQGIVSSLLLAKALRKANVLPEYDLGLAIVADEENGSGFGIDYVLKNRPEIIRAKDYIIIPDAGNEDGTMIETAEKSILWIKCEISGKQTHASTPEKGINAHRASAHFILKMHHLYTEFPDADSVYDPPISTFEPTKKETNVDNVNTIPGHDVIYFDCRILPKYPIESVKTKIREYADEIQDKLNVRIDISYPNSIPAPPPTSPDAPVALALQEAVRDILNRDAKPIGIGGGTVAAFFREAGLPAVCWMTVDDTLHGPNEYCKIENVINDAKVFAHVCMQD